MISISRCTVRGKKSTYDKSWTNLHHIRDSQILEQLAGGSTQGTTQSFAQRLASAVNTDTSQFGWVVKSWLDGMSLNNAQGSAMKWIQEANAYVYSDVLAGRVGAVESLDLDGASYNAHVDVARVQYVREGCRLGARPDLIATGT